MLKLIKSSILIIALFSTGLVCANPVEDALQNVQPTAADSGVVSLYMASWCPHCRKAKEYLDNLGIEYVIYDIETPQGQEKFEALNAPGIPIITVGEVRMDGFNPMQLDKALCEYALLDNCGAVVS